MDDLDSDIRRHGDIFLFQRLLKYLKPHMGKFIFSLVLMFLSLAVEIFSPLMIGILLSMIIKEGQPIALAEATKTIVIFTSSMSVLVLITFVTMYFQNMMLQKIGQQVVFVLRQEVFQHIETLSLGQVNKVPVGKLVTRVTNDTMAISEMFTSVLISLLSNIIYIVGIAILLFILSWKVALVALAFIPLIAIATMIFRKFSRRAHRKTRDGLSDINAFLAENLSGIKVTQIFNREEQKSKEFRTQSVKQRSNYFKTIRVYAVFRPVIYILSTIATILIIWLSINEVVVGLLLITTLPTIYIYIGQFFNPIEQLAELFDVLQEAFSSAEKIFLVLDTKPEIIDPVDAVDLEVFTGKIEFKNVWFSYIEDEWVLKNVSFTVHPGEVVAFVGATGSGKTTIMNLIAKNYEVKQGEILLDGINIKNIKQSSVRKHVGQMLQDVFLFNDTIKNNITMRDQDISLEDVKRVSKYVGADRFIEVLPNDYEHMVLERGNNFSSGQRQLLSFARALMYKPSLIILDEATANVDSETENLIQESLNRIMIDQTMIIVAHRLSTIQHSDKIIVLHKGEIQEMGNHQQLLLNKKMYYHLYELQFTEKKIESGYTQTN